MTEPSELEALTSDVKKLRADLAKLADTVGNLASESGGDMLKAGRRFAHELTGDLQGHAREVTEAIEEKPFTASMIAFGFGVLLGTVLTGGRR